MQGQIYTIVTGESAVTNIFKQTKYFRFLENMIVDADEVYSTMQGSIWSPASYSLSLAAHALSGHKLPARSKLEGLEIAWIF